jgi:hypothetical protein
MYKEGQSVDLVLTVSDGPLKKRKYEQPALLEVATRLR